MHYSLYPQGFGSSKILRGIILEKSSTVHYDCKKVVYKTNRCELVRVTP